MMDDLLQEMINPAPAPRDAPRRWRLWTTVVVVGLAAVGATTLTTSALFSDDDQTSASIGSGSVNLALGDPVPFDISPEGLAPGSSTFMPITVSNQGSLELRYAISYFGTPGTGGGGGDLSDVLELRLYAVSDCSADGTLGATTINNSGGAVNDWPTAAEPLVGDPAVGPHDGDRTIQGGVKATQDLCARVDFPKDAGNAYQDTSVELTLVFNAEQTLNNS